MFDSPSSMRAAARKYRLVASRLVDQEVVNLFTAVAADHDLQAELLEARQPSNGIACLVGWPYGA
jgi:hypothetical protein